MLIKLDLACRIRKKGLVRIGPFRVGAQCRKPCRVRKKGLAKIGPFRVGAQCRKPCRVRKEV